MFSEILKIIPKMDKGELEKLEKNMSSRFTKIAKNFGKGLKNIFKGGGWVGAAIGLLNKIMNPLKDIQESMEATLKYSDDVVTNAAQFGTTAGKLSKLVALGEATGLDSQSLYTLINKFQNAVVSAKADPTAPSTVRNYVGTTDYAEGFFRFIQNLRSAPKDDSLLAQQEVFGEKQILKAADFIGTDFADLLNKMQKNGLKSTDYYDRAFNRGGELSDLADRLGAVRNLNNNAMTANAMNTGMILQQDQAEKARQERLRAQVKSYSDIAKLAEVSERVEGLINQALAQVGKLLTFLEGPAMKLITAIQDLGKAPWVQKMIGYFSKMGGGR
ncbi:hypothetical protein BdPhPhi1402_gp24 [Bdellovibrio phage phi1402]|uniref:hypothetical protein n=1 Tax=Bdellovibrio phage phi1402 TaxID=1035662 RepID=UPI000211A2D6|nr:hypothetical protein BdPhPhi1402_gp24 [Bdellovibrio phage phi1402]AEG42321.1 hypothetical protein [Bdellovibrio phage phi1402]